MSEWQDIEMAPKDGSYFLGAQFQRGEWFIEKAWWDGGDWGEFRYSGYHLEFQPSHWMPLPEPPQASTTSV